MPEVPAPNSGVDGRNDCNDSFGKLRELNGTWEGKTRQHPTLNESTQNHPKELAFVLSILFLSKFVCSKSLWKGSPRLQGYSPKAATQRP